jgi:hypothetical protein
MEHESTLREIFFEVPEMYSTSARLSPRLQFWRGSNATTKMASSRGSSLAAAKPVVMLSSFPTCIQEKKFKLS